MALPKVHGGPVVGGGIVHRDPEAKSVQLSPVAAREGAVLVVLVPLEALVGVHHQQVRADPHLVMPPGVPLGEPAAPRHLPEDRGDGGVVQELGKAFIRRPGRTLNIVVKARNNPRHRPDVRVLDLPLGDVTQILDPVRLEHPLDVHHAVPFQGLEMLSSDAIEILGGLVGVVFDGKRDVRGLLPVRVLGHQIPDADGGLGGGLLGPGVRLCLL
mmetsp:Transcript_15743/g.36275  ORF Transcript_15743/g.36275 Transcript_15743/m.36275 type:complete len:214 (-) Transcript_15743:285-926(-)